MTLKELKKELEGDVRNKLTLPRTVLERILMKDESLKTEHIEKAINSIDQIPHLIEEWLRKFEVEKGKE